MKFATAAMALAVGFTLTTGAWTRADDKNKDKGDHQASASGQHQMIQGVLAGVTVVGETMVNYESNRAQTAEVSYLTIAGSPVGNGSQHEQGQQGKNDQSSSKQISQAGNQSSEKSSRGQGEDKQQTASNQGQGSRENGSNEMNSYDNIYLIAVSPKTEVCECSEGDNAKGQEKNGQNKKQCEFAALELGDRVEVEFARNSSQNQQAKNTKHGRHRVIQGVADSITVLRHKKNHGGGSDQGSSSHESKGSQDSKQQDKD